MSAFVSVPSAFSRSHVHVNDQEQYVRPCKCKPCLTSSFIIPIRQKSAHRQLQCYEHPNPYQTRSAPTHPSATLPPLPTLVAISALSTHPSIPSSVRNAPIAFLLSAFLTNVNLLPSSSIVYSQILDLAPYAVALLLLSSSLSSPSSSNASTSSSPSSANYPPYVLFIPFLIGALATFVASIIPAFVPLPAPFIISKSLLASVLAAFAATYIGGSLNFVAIVNLLNIPTQTAAAAIAIDMACMAVYFALLFAIAARINQHQTTPVTNADDNEMIQVQPLDNKSFSSSSSSSANKFSLKSITLMIVQFLIPICTSVVLVQSSNFITTFLNLPSASTFSLMLSSTIAYILPNTLLPKYSSSPSSSWNNIFSNPIIHQTTTVILSLFFCSLGASARLSTLTVTSPIVILCAVFILSSHALLVYLVGHKMLGLPGKRLLIASNCNIGGATTAPVYAAACGWNRYVPSAVAAGTLGYLIATPLSLLVFRIASGSPL